MSEEKVKKLIFEYLKNNLTVELEKVDYYGSKEITIYLVDPKGKKVKIDSTCY